MTLDPGHPREIGFVRAKMTHPRRDQPLSRLSSMEHSIEPGEIGFVRVNRMLTKLGSFAHFPSNHLAISASCRFTSSNYEFSKNIGDSACAHRDRRSVSPDVEVYDLGSVPRLRRHNRICPIDPIPWSIPQAEHESSTFLSAIWMSTGSSSAGVRLPPTRRGGRYEDRRGSRRA